MKKVFDLMAIFCGIIGLGGLLINAGSLSAETAALFSARAILVIAFVVVPFFIARAIEKSSLNLPVKRIVPARQPQAAAPTPYFDYLFQPGSAFDWRSNRIVAMPSRRNADDARSMERGLEI